MVDKVKSLVLLLPRKPRQSEPLIFDSFEIEATIGYTEPNFLLVNTRINLTTKNRSELEGS